MHAHNTQMHTFEVIISIHTHIHNTIIYTRCRLKDVCLEHLVELQKEPLLFPTYTGPVWKGLKNRAGLNSSMSTAHHEGERVNDDFCNIPAL